MVTISTNIPFKKSGSALKVLDMHTKNHHYKFKNELAINPNSKILKLAWLKIVNGEISCQMR